MNRPVSIANEFGNPSIRIPTPSQKSMGRLERVSFSFLFVILISISLFASMKLCFKCGSFPSPPPPLKPRRYLAVTIGKTTDIECGYLPADSSYPSAQLHFRSQELRPPPIQPKTNFFLKKKKSPETKVHWNHPAI